MMVFQFNGQARYIYRREIMKDIIFTDPSKGYEIEVIYKNGDKSSKFFTINQLQKANNYFNKMNDSIDKNVYKVTSKIAQVVY